MLHAVEIINKCCMVLRSQCEEFFVYLQSDHEWILFGLKTSLFKVLPKTSVFNHVFVIKYSELCSTTQIGSLLNLCLWTAFTPSNS